MLSFEISILCCLAVVVVRSVQLCTLASSHLRRTEVGPFLERGSVTVGAEFS